jgi:hypothetical protein
MQPEALPSATPFPSPVPPAPSLAPQPEHISSGALGATVGTLGIGGTLEKSFGDGTFDVRLLTGFFTYARSGNASGVNYNANVQLSNFLFVADVHPGGGSFRIGAGVSFGSGTKATVTGVPGPNGYTIDGNTYGSAQLAAVNGGVKFSSGAPVVLLGFGGGRTRPGLGFSLDLGAIFQNPTTYVTPTYGPEPDGINDPSTLQGQIFAQDLATLENDLKNGSKYLQVYPIINIGLVFRF